MNILLVNTNQNGGAGIACSRLHSALLGEGLDADMLVKNGAGNRIKILPQNDHNNGYEKLFYKIDIFLKELKIRPRQSALQREFIAFTDNRYKQGLEFFSLPSSDIDITRSVYYQKADVVNLHWVSGFLDYKSFFKKNIKPIVWTLHDMNPLLNGNHYQEVYSGINAEGFLIPRVISDEERRFSSLVRKEKQRIFKNIGDNISFVCLCSWMQRELVESEYFSNNRNIVIENSIDTSVYRHRNKQFARELLGLPLEIPIFLYVADSLNNNRKGLSFLIKAIEQEKFGDALFCALGHGTASSSILHFGAITDQRMMSVLYSAADAFIIPSIEDNTPNTVLESLCCGTPVIGFPVGGIPELVNTDSGILAHEISVDSLVKAIISFLDNPERFDSTRIQKHAHERFSMKRQALEYEALFKNVSSQK